MVLAVFLLACLIAVSDVDSQTTSPNQCDEVTTHTVNTDCTNCRSNIRVKCPVGLIKTTRGRGKKGCRYRIGGIFSRPVRGCSHTCISTRKEPRCCRNFWGQDCQSCPMGSFPQAYVCSGRGICFDGINGNGTCQCRGNVVGSICESCSMANQYGPNCEHTCACIHGQCDNGVGRTGRCECESGYGGAACDIVLTECINMHCSPYARCLNESGSLECRCNVGYEGNRTVCNEIDPCQDNSSNLCHQFATCRHTGPGQYDCVCRSGFSGDGRWCSPIDPCQKNNGGCSEKSTICEYTGPGESRCSCRKGYANATGSDCQLMELCGLYPNTTCDSSANCTTTADEYGVIGVTCACPVGTIAKELRCYTDILTEIMKANETGTFQNLLNNAILMFSSNYFHELSFLSAYTVLIPTDDAFGSNFGQPNRSVNWKTIARNHMVVGAVEIMFENETASSMYTLLGSNSSLKALLPTASDAAAGDGESGIFATLMFNNVLDGHFITPPRCASNGLFYVIDTLMYPPLFPFNYDASNMSLLQTLQMLPMCSNFQGLLVKSFTTRHWIRNQNFTLLLPNDNAFQSLSSDELKYLQSPEGLSQLDILLRHHFVLRPLSVTELVYRTTVQTPFDKLLVNISDSGAVYIGKEKSKVLVSEIPIKGGNYIYVIDKIMFPSTIEKLVDNVCPSVRSAQVVGPCGACGRITARCEDGDTFVPGKDTIRCPYLALTDTSPVFLRGCKYSCQRNTSIDDCCPGFYGSGCWSCPGPIHSTCNNNGVCDDGRQGSGDCNCYDGFVGPDCSVCSSNTTYGPDCNQNCTCSHGRCVNSATSRGECTVGSCLPGWSGENCDRRSQPCGAPSIVCHQLAKCLVDDAEGESCQCMAGYTGDGMRCEEYNPCIDDDNRGGCHVNAWCFYYGRGNYTCTCMEFYKGDGRLCEAINPCEELSDRCSDNAQCIYTGPGLFQCLCMHGYRGDGRICREVNNCLENNGGCHYRATCAPSGPGHNTCTCSDGYQGDGRVCVGNLMMEIRERNQLSLIQSWIDSFDTVSDFFLSINYGQVTAFLPTNNAWERMSADNYHFWVNRDHLTYVFRHHVVTGVLSTSSMRINSKLDSLLPTAPISVTNITDQSTFTDARTNLTVTNVAPTLGKNFAKIIVPDLQTFGGLLHIIDAILLPPRDIVQDYPSLQDLILNSTDTPFQPFSLFLSYLNTTGVFDRMNSSARIYTIFALKNNLFNPSDIGLSGSLFFSYHVIVGKLLRLDSIDSGQHESTLAGPEYQITLVKHHTLFLVNGQELVGEGIRTQYGIIYSLSSSFLTPTKRDCAKPSMELHRSGCQPCTSLLTCPAGDTLLAKLPCQQLSLLPTGSALPKFMCNLLCLHRTVKTSCCSGFFGSDCEPCPGGVGNVCYKKGRCNDGTFGSGKCTCNSNRVSGPACDECATNYYGDSCDLQCKCVNGTCFDGRRGTGACSCDKGFTGATCNRTKSSTNACQGKCHSAATCQLRGKCICDWGYTGNGTFCSAVNPCDNEAASNCHQYAACRYSGPGLHRCICKQGYTGDGIECMEINPCLNKTLIECDPEAVCRHTGPAQHNCICKDHFTGDGKTCEPVDVCSTGNTNCHENARCINSGSGAYRCECLLHYSRSGINCVGDIYAHLMGDRRYAYAVRSNVNLRAALYSDNSLTVFLPYVADGERLNANLTDLNHVVGCSSLNRTELEQFTQLYALDGSLLNITRRDRSLTVNGARLLDDGQLLSNGILYTINGSLVRDKADEFGALLLNSNSVESIFEGMGAVRFMEMLNFTNTFDYLRASLYRSWTVFVPLDSAFDQLSSYKQRQLRTDKNVAKEYVRYHLVSQGSLKPIDLLKRQELTTDQGSSISLACSPAGNGQITINLGRAVVKKFEMVPSSPAWNEITASIFVIDSILEPPSVGGRCDVVNTTQFEGTCTFCSVTSAMRCPSGMKKIGQKRALCSSRIFGLPLPRLVSGCKSLCLRYNVTRKCCSGYYGRDCHRCPIAGNPGQLCSGNGVCNEGIEGSGACSCKDGYRGVACELCIRGRFGRDCRSCGCSLHGKCEEGLQGSGFCHCDENWFGPKCDQKVASNASCDGTCDANAICRSDGRCECKFGYEGHGVLGCDPIDFCGLNPCSVHATCHSVQFSVFCACQHPYVGDGYVCTGFDPCTNQSTSPLCHPLARCVYVGPNVTRCQCSTGYIGDGVNACVVDETQFSPPPSCASNNGDCAQDATCNETNDAVNKKVTVTCSCKDDFAGDGYICNGNLYEILSQGLYGTGRFYQKAVRKDFLYLIRLRSSLNMTLFVPNDESLVARRLSRKVLPRHIVTGTLFLEQDLRNSSSIFMDSRTAFPLQTGTDGSLYVNGVKVLTTDIPATNGILHVIDDVIPSQISRLPFTTAAAAATTTKNLPSAATSQTITASSVEPVSTQLTDKSTATSTSSLLELPVRSSSSSSVKVGVSVGIVFLILFVVFLLYWRRRNAMIVFRPLSERISGTRLEESLYELPIGGGIENPAYDSTAFREPAEGTLLQGGEQDALIFTESSSTS